jgi:uncharacterized protein
MDTVPKPIRDVIMELEKGLKEFYGDRFRGLLLYGSYARGTAWEGSDVDLLLLLAEPLNPSREILALGSVAAPLSLDSGLVLSVMPASADAFEKGESMFLRIVRREAVPIAA